MGRRAAVRVRAKDSRNCALGVGRRFQLRDASWGKAFKNAGLHVHVAFDRAWRCLSLSHNVRGRRTSSQTSGPYYRPALTCA